MYKNRLICDDDAILGLKSMAALVAGYGQPATCENPSLLRRQSGLEFMLWNRTGPTPVWAWAEQALSRIVSTVPTSQIAWQLTRSQSLPGANDLRELMSLAPGQIQFDPNRCDASGEFVTYSILQVAQQVFHNLDKAGLPQETESYRIRGMQYLSTAAFLQHGPVLLHHLRKVEWHFSAIAGPVTGPDGASTDQTFDLENTIIFMTVLVQAIHQRPLAQIIPMFGSQINRTRSEKIHRALRQIQAYQPELKLIRLMKGPRRTDPTELADTAPARNAWSQTPSTRTYGT